jgi:MFS family permease
VVGSWTTQSVFQLVRTPSRTFAGQMLMGGFDPGQVSIGLAGAMLVFFAGLLYWGNKFKALRRTTIIFIGIGGGLLMLAAIFALNHSMDWGTALQVLLALLAVAGLFVMAGATPAALGLLADMSESHPEDRGAIMGLYSVFLAVGQITGSLVGGAAADWRGIDGILAASLGLLVIAVLPIHRLRASEHLLTATDAPVRPSGIHRAVRGEGLD